MVKIQTAQGRALYLSQKISVRRWTVRSARGQFVRPAIPLPLPTEAARGASGDWLVVMRPLVQGIAEHTLEA